MRLLLNLTLLVGILSSTACKGNPDVLVAEREMVDASSLPRLSAMNLTNANIEFSIGSVAHARLIPEASWPEPVNKYLNLAQERSAEPLDSAISSAPQRCIYVGLADSSSHFRRLEVEGRPVLLTTFLRQIPEEEKTEDEIARNAFARAYLGLIDESTMDRGTVFSFDSIRFDAFEFGGGLALLSSIGSRLNYRQVRKIDETPELSDAMVLYDSEFRIDSFKALPIGNQRVAVIWVTERLGSLAERRVLFAIIDLEDPNISSPTVLTNTASNTFLRLARSGDELWVFWTDSRFASRGFDYKNVRKLIGRIVAPNLENHDILALNRPYETSDTPRQPILAWSDGNSLYFGWTQNPARREGAGRFRVGSFDPSYSKMSVTDGYATASEIVSEALDQKTEYERDRPIPNFERLNPRACDNLNALEDSAPSQLQVLSPTNPKNDT